MSIRAEGLTELQEQFSREAPRRMRVLASQTLNRGAARGSTRLVRIVTEQLNLKAGYVREQVRVRKATSDRLESRIIGRKRPILLSEFDARQRTKARPRRKGDKRVKGEKRAKVNAGISIRIKRGGPREVLPGTFLFRSPKNGALITAVRVPVGGSADGRRKRVGRFPIEALYGPSVDQVYRANRPQIAIELRDYVRGELDRRIAAETLGDKPGKARSLRVRRLAGELQ